MLNSKKITINGKTITVTEVSVKKVLQLMPGLNPIKKEDAPEDPSVEVSFMSNIDALLQETCGITMDDLQEMHSSELEVLWQTFYEVNSFFFQTLAALGLEEKARTIFGILLQVFGGWYVNCFAAVIRGVSITDSPGLTPLSATPPETTGTNA